MVSPARGEIHRRPKDRGEGSGVPDTWGHWTWRQNMASGVADRRGVEGISMWRQSVVNICLQATDDMCTSVGDHPYSTLHPDLAKLESIFIRSKEGASEAPSEAALLAMQPPQRSTPPACLFSETWDGGGHHPAAGSERKGPMPREGKSITEDRLTTSAFGCALV